MISNWEMVMRLLLGAALGGIIGFERQTHGRPAGFRTQLLVCVASVLFMLVSEYGHYLGSIDPSYMRIDPARIAQGAITGVGFLGAGVVLKTGFTVQGLTTAACIWIVSAIGIAVGSGLYVASIAATAITYFALWVLRNIERTMTRLTFKNIAITTAKDMDESSILDVFKNNGSAINGMNLEFDREKEETVYHYSIYFTDKTSLKKLVEDLSLIEPIKRVIVKG